MLLLVALLQVMPGIPACTGAKALPIGSIVDCADGVLVPAERLDKRRADLLACEVERDGARQAVDVLRGLPQLLEQSFARTIAELRAEMERQRAESLARLVEVATPKPSPWWRSPWLWGAAGAIVGGSTVWGLTR